MVTGLIIGGAIGSVIGRRMMEKHEEGADEEKEADEAEE